LSAVVPVAEHLRLRDVPQAAAAGTLLKRRFIATPTRIP
jgi:hypothetical protein